MGPCAGLHCENVTAKHDDAVKNPWLESAREARILRDLQYTDIHVRMVCSFDTVD